MLDKSTHLKGGGGSSKFNVILYIYIFNIPGQSNACLTWMAPPIFLLPVETSGMEKDLCQSFLVSQSTPEWALI